MFVDDEDPCCWRCQAGVEPRCSAHGIGSVVPAAGGAYAIYHYGFEKPALEARKRRAKRIMAYSGAFQQQLNATTERVDDMRRRSKRFKQDLATLEAKLAGVLRTVGDLRLEHSLPVDRAQEQFRLAGMAVSGYFKTLDELEQKFKLVEEGSAPGSEGQQALAAAYVDSQGVDQKVQKVTRAMRLASVSMQLAKRAVDRVTALPRIEPSEPKPPVVYHGRAKPLSVRLSSSQTW